MTMTRHDPGCRIIPDFPCRLVGCLPLLAVGLLHAGTYTVTTTGDNGTGSLRWAIAQANASTDSSNTIMFDIPGSGVHSIKPVSALPPVTTVVTIDGYSQPGSALNTLNTGASNAVLLIELDGSQAGMADGLRFDPGSSGVVSGLVINRFQGAGIYLAAGDGDFDSSWARIWGNFIGTDASGTLAQGNGNGIVVDGGSSAIIGQHALDTAIPQCVNLISGNLGYGVDFSTVHQGGVSGNENFVYNNLIGSTASGTVALGNGSDGIFVAPFPAQPYRRLTIKQNVIVANAGDGVAILSGRGTIQNNLIGVGVGTLGANGPALGNAGDGVYVGGQAGAVTVGDNLYSGFAAGHASIANNGGAGLYVDGNALVDVSAQGFDNNGGLGIDIAPTGVNANDVGDSDGGPNERLNAPVLDSVGYNPVTGYGDVAGHLDSNPGVSVGVALYHSESCDPSGNGEGTVWKLHGSWPDDSHTIVTDPNGHTEFTLHSGSLQPGMAITYLAQRFSTIPGSNAIVVSEFSNCLVVPNGDVIFVQGFEESE